MIFNSDGTIRRWPKDDINVIINNKKYCPTTYVYEVNVVKPKKESFRKTIARYGPKQSDLKYKGIL